EGSIEFWLKVYNIGGIKDRVLMKGNSWNVGFPYAIYLGSGVRVYLWLEDSSIEVMSSDINYNEWYHVVATWNSSEARIYINGSLDDNVTGPQNMYANEEDFEIGGKTTDWGPEGPFNGSIDELILYNKVLSAEEVSEHFNSNFENVTGAEWNISSLEDGTYSWNCFAYDNETSNWSSSNYTFYIDLQTPPSVNSITLSPGSEDDVDPGVTINVTANVTDPSNVSFVVFQWKETGEWNNSMMDYNNSTGLYENASITIDGSGGNYLYRIWSNDTLNHSDYSSEYNITAEWDYTWTRSPADFGTVLGFIGTVNQTGILTINNTGDDALNFSFSDDWPWPVYYNGSETSSFILGEKNATDVNITAQFASSDEEREMIMTITASHSSQTPSPASAIVNTTLNSYTGGPYFNVEVVSPPTTVSQSQTFNLTAKVKNIGNETSTITWLNWTFPSGWSVAAGNISNNVSTLGSQSTYWTNITVYVNPNTASPGTKIIYVNVSCNESVNGSASALIGVECSNTDSVCGTGCSYVTDDDCSPPSGGTGGPATVYPSLTKDYTMVLDIPSRLDINRGDSKTFKVGVKNPVIGTRLDNVYLSLSGYPQTFVSITPSYLTGIGYDEMRYFEVEIKAPVYVVYKEYDLSVTVKGEFIEAGKTTSSEKTGGMLLVTQKFVENETLEYFEDAKEALEEINKSGFETKGMSEMLEEIEEALEKGNYDRVKELSEEVIEIKDLALELNGQMEEMGNNIGNFKQQNVNLPETEKMLFLAKSAFQRGDYERAEERMSNALLVYNMEIANAGLWILIYNYWWLILPVLIVSGAGAVMMRRRFIIKSIKRGLDSLVEDEKTIMNLIIKLQEEHFLERKIGLEEYQNMMGNYEEYVAGMGERRIDLITKLVGMLRVSKAIEKLKEEGERVERRIKELQKDYFELGNIGKRYYDNLIGSLKNEMIEIEKMIDMVGSERNV
ncbi:MAG: hypothetical protein KAW40_01050, partial [Candidatus Aenigmarchaeota archaeon]|nr:hypothetical protein [Candidatus Aenigmarchaeota archaeon]